MAYSLDFRKRVMRIKEERNFTFEATSEHFGIAIRTLFRWQQNIKPKLKRNKPATKIDMEKLAEDVKRHPDSFQYERAKRFNVGTTAIFYALKRLGVSYKKNPESPQSRLRKTYYFPV